jgi:type IV secretory pathway VirB10-like protein
MISRPAAVGLLAAGCLTAAAGGAYMAVRQNTAAAAATPAPIVLEPATAAPSPAPVAETETVIEPTAKETPKQEAPRVVPEPPPAPASRPARRPAPAVARTTRPPVVNPPVSSAPVPERPIESAPPAVDPPSANPAPQPMATAPEPPPRVEAPAVPQFEEIMVPAAAVIGLEVETPITSETAKIEDRVEARVTRDVYADGKLAIPSGSRVIGSVTVVERGGKVKERARLGVRFHTLVLADGRQIDLRTDPIYREGQSPTGESSKKIGGAAVGGAVLGAIMGGGKGAIIGGAAGAAGGTAAVMAGGRNAATIPSGTVLTARLASAVTIEVERR